MRASSTKTSTRICTDRSALRPVKLRSHYNSRHLPKASIVIPTLNCWHVLKVTLKGLSFQTCSMSCFEVVVSDDGSKDGLLDFLACLQLPYNVRVIRGPERRNSIGLASVRNRGILAASNEIIITLDADCLPVPWFVESHLAHFAKKLGPLVVIGIRKFVAANSWRVLGRQGFSLRMLSLPEIRSLSNFGWMRDRRLPELVRLNCHPMPFNCFHTCNASFRRQDAIRAGLFDEDFDGRWGYEDIEFGYRLWNLPAKIQFEPGAVVLHQENELHTLNERLSGKAANFELACAKIPHFREFRDRLGR